MYHVARARKETVSLLRSPRLSACLPQIVGSSSPAGGTSRGSAATRRTGRRCPRCLRSPARPAARPKRSREPRGPTGRSSISSISTLPAARPRPRRPLGIYGASFALSRRCGLGQQSTGNPLDGADFSASSGRRLLAGHDGGDLAVVRLSAAASGG